MSRPCHPMQRKIVYRPYGLHAKTTDRQNSTIGFHSIPRYRCSIGCGNGIGSAKRWTEANACDGSLDYFLSGRNTRIRGSICGAIYTRATALAKHIAGKASWLFPSKFRIGIKCHFSNVVYNSIYIYIYIYILRMSIQT